MCSEVTQSLVSFQAPDDFYEGITFEHFEQVCTYLIYADISIY